MIGLFLKEEIPRGMSFAETVAAIKGQGGLVYLPHPFDRMHSIPEPATLHRHLADIDVFEVYNARLLFEAYNDEALRFARKYNLTMGAGSDAHVLPGLATGGLRMRAFDGPEEFMLSLRSGGGPEAAEVARLPPVTQVGRPGQGKSPLDENWNRAAVTSVSTDEIYEKYLKKAIAEINDLGHEIAAAGNGERVPVLGSGHPLADVMLLKYRPQPAEIQEGVAFYGRAGQAILKSLQRLNVDPMSVYGTNCLKFADESDDEARPFLVRELHIVQPKLVVVMGEDAFAFLNGLDFPLAGELEPDARRRCSDWTPTVQVLYVPDIDASLDEQPSKTKFWNAFKALGHGGPSCRPTRRSSVALGVYYVAGDSLPISGLVDAGRCSCAFLVIPAVFGLVYLALPLWRMPRLLQAGIVVAVLAVVFSLVGLDVLAELLQARRRSRSSAWWFLSLLRDVRLGRDRGA